MISHESVLSALHDSVEVISSPRNRLRALVYAFTCWHARHHQAARVTQNELGALAPDAFEQVAALRRTTMRIFHEELRAGVSAGDLDVADISGTARALSSLGIDVARWYRPTGERSPEDVGALYAHLAARMLGAP